jgi:glutathione S-transferase
MGKYDTAFQLHPRPNSPEFPRYLEWVHAAEGAIFLPGLLQVYFSRVDMTGNPAQAMMAAEREKAAATIEAHLSKYPYFAGEDFTAADCLMGFQILMTNAQGGLENRPATKAWFEKMQARPGWQKMMEVGI